MTLYKKELQRQNDGLANEISIKEVLLLELEDRVQKMSANISVLKAKYNEQVDIIIKLKN